MDFFLSRDWLNREPPYAFQWDHLVFIFFIIATAIGLSFLLHKKSRKTVEITLIALWAFGFAVAISYYVMTWVQSAQDPSGHPFNLQGDLPLHSCLMFFYVFPLAIFVKNKIVRTAASNFLVIVNMIMGFITLFVGCPPVGKAAFSYSGFQSLTYHGIIFIVPVLMLVTGYYDLKIKDIFYGLAAFGILGTAMWIFDHFSGCDYFYFYDGHTFPILHEISDNVHHLVWTLLIVFCYVTTGVIIHFLVLGIKYLVNKKLNNKKEISN